MGGRTRGSPFPPPPTIRSAGDDRASHVIPLQVSRRRAPPKAIRRARRRADLAAEAGRLGRDVAAVADHDRIDEMLVQVIDELGDAIVHAARHGDVIEHRQVLHQLAQPDAARMRTDRHAELRRHQDHCEVLVDAAEAATVDLAEVDGPRLQELLEHDAVGAVLACGHADRPHRLRGSPHAEDVVGAGLLLDPPRIEAPGARTRAIASFTSSATASIISFRIGPISRAPTPAAARLPAVALTLTLNASSLRPPLHDRAAGRDRRCIPSSRPTSCRPDIPARAASLHARASTAAGARGSRSPRPASARR